MAVADSTAVARWKSVPGYSKYRVSTAGGVQSRYGRNGAVLPAGQWRDLTPVPDGHGYPQVRLSRRGDRPKWFGIHQLVLLAFVGPAPAGQVARHVLTNDPTDNRLENLTYGTQSQNCQDKEAHGTAQQGEQHPRAKLSQADVHAIRFAVIADPRCTMTMMARIHGVTHGSVWGAVRRRTWTKCAS